KHGPLKAVPPAFAAASLLHLLEYALLRFGTEAARGPMIALVYLHLVGLGAILLSGYWSVAGEVFDPREARLQFGRITAAGTGGGIVGGILAERCAALFGGEALLLLLAALHLGAWAALRSSALSSGPPVETQEPDRLWHAAREAFRQAPFLVNLCALMLLGTV